VSDKKILRAEALALVELMEADVLAAGLARYREQGAHTSGANFQKWNAKEQAKLALFKRLRKDLQGCGESEVVAEAEGTAS
jgi:hypothetical protein